MADMRYSIIVPVYNAESFLDQCVCSVMEQQVSDWELILVDDGSTDESGKIAQCLAGKDPRIHVIHQENQGQFFARQTGIRASQGDYLLFLDCDDLLDRNCLSVLDKVIELHQSDIILFVGHIFEEGEDTGRAVGYISDNEMPVSIVKLREKLLYSHELNSMCLKSFRRSLFENDCQDYSDFKQAQFGEDKAQMLAPVTCARDIWYVPNALYEYHRRSSSITRSVTIAYAEKMLANEMFSLLRKYVLIWKMDGKEYWDRLDAYYLRNYLSVYYGVRKTLKTTSDRRKFRRFPWKQLVYRPAFRFGAVRLLIWRDRVRLAAAYLRL